MSELRYADLTVPINVSVSYLYTEGYEGDSSIPNGTQTVFHIENVRIIEADDLADICLADYVKKYEQENDGE